MGILKALGTRNGRGGGGSLHRTTMPMAGTTPTEAGGCPPPRRGARRGPPPGMGLYRGGGLGARWQFGGGGGTAGEGFEVFSVIKEEKKNQKKTHKKKFLHIKVLQVVPGGRGGGGAPVWRSGGGGRGSQCWLSTQTGLGARDPPPGLACCRGGGGCSLHWGLPYRALEGAGCSMGGCMAWPPPSPAPPAQPGVPLAWGGGGVCSGGGAVLAVWPPPPPPWVLAGLGFGYGSPPPPWVWGGGGGCPAGRALGELGGGHALPDRAGGGGGALLISISANCS